MPGGSPGNPDQLGPTLNYLHYGSGHLHQINLDGRIVCDIERDALHREVHRSQGRLHTRWQRDARGRPLQQWCSQGALAVLPRLLQPGQSNNPSGLTAQPWPALLRPARLSGAAITTQSKAWHWDAAGELSQRIDPIQGEQHLGYDDAGRILRSRNVSAGQSLSAGLDFSDVLQGSQQPHPHLAAVPEADWREDFAWDAASNPRQATQGSDGHVRHNRLLMWQDQRFAYDRLGRLIHKQVGRHTEQHLRWNAEHQLESVQTRRGADTHAQSQRVYFEYDALGRRISKTNGFGSVFFIWEGLRLLQEHHRSRITTLVYEPDSYVPLARIDTTPQGPSGDASAAANDAANDAANEDNGSPPPKPRLYWFHTNPSGAPEELTDEEGRVHWRARYKSWGNLALQEQPEADSDRFAQPSLQEQNLRLQGQYFDAETGLCYNTFRYYDPDCGRFISQDPIGLAGGMNLYQFAPNAIGWIDPWGWAGNPATATHVTYRGIDAATGKPYIGYASMQGNQAAADIVKYRYGGDYSRFGGQAPEVLYEGYGKNGKATARGLEQHHFKEAGGLKGTANKQNPVGQNNPRRSLYARKAAAHLKPKTSSTSRC